MPINEHILNAIGNTPLIPLRKIVPPGSAKILLKLESANTTGSMKDRMALAMVEGGEKSGRLKPGDGVIEFTGGSTGTSLALVCAVKGYPLQIVTSDAFSQEKRDHMRAFGAKLEMVPSDNGRLNRALIDAMRAKTQQLIQETGYFWTDQFNNIDQANGYQSLGEEIWAQTDHHVTAFVHSVGTGGSMRGTATTLKRLNPNIQITAVEPAESPVLSGGESGSHHIEGMGVGFIPPLWNADVVDSVISFSSENAMQMARRLSSEEGIFAGTSTGANVLAAQQVASELGEGATVVTVAIDSGLKYLSTALYRGD